jgi:hypothetical protein
MMNLGEFRMSDARYLLSQAERCFRLAGGAASPRLADELEALGRDFEQEARRLELANGRYDRGSHAMPLVAETA